MFFVRFRKEKKVVLRYAFCLLIFVYKSLKINRSSLDEAVAETTHEQEKLESNRTVLFKEIEPGYTVTYERVRQARDGIGMSSIISRACGSCFSQLPPQTVIEIKSNDKRKNRCADHSVLRSCCD